jgi:hypothetical protein
MVILTVWYLVQLFTFLKNRKDIAVEVKSTEPIVMPKDGYLASVSSPFAEITEEYRGTVPAFAMELEPIVNPLYGKAQDKKARKNSVKEEAKVNHQEKRDNSFIDLGMFDVDGTWDPSLDTANQASVLSAKEDPHKLLLAELADQPWQKVTVDVVGLDITFSLDGKVLRTNRLPEPIEDIPGDGSLLVGARYPKEHRFTGEIKKLSFYESVKLPATPDDGPGFDGRPPAPGSLLKDAPVNVLGMGDDPRRSVKQGSEARSKLFDGGFHTSLKIPTQLHPGLNEDKCPTCFKIEVEFKQKKNTSGYVMAKTDSAGISRYFALAICNTKKGMSIQFYYRPKGSVQGHRLSLANDGMYTNEDPMDADYLISGLLSDQNAPVTAAAQRAANAEAETSISAKSKFAALEKKKDEAPAPRESKPAPKRKASLKMQEKLMAAQGKSVGLTSLAEDGTAVVMDEAEKAEKLKKDMQRLTEREVELRSIIAAGTTLRNSAAEAERVALLKDAEVRKLQTELKAAEVRASRAVTKRDAQKAAAFKEVQQQQGKDLEEALKPGSKVAGMAQPTHLSLTAGVTPVTVPESASGEGASVLEMLAVLSMFPDLN